SATQTPLPPAAPSRLLARRIRDAGLVRRNDDTLELGLSRGCLVARPDTGQNAIVLRSRCCLFGLRSIGRFRPGRLGGLGLRSALRCLAAFRTGSPSTPPRLTRRRGALSLYLALGRNLGGDSIVL